MAASRAAYAVPPQHDDAHLLHVGEQCSSPSCSVIDFLPLKCQHCSQAFCGSHFMPTAHQCTKYDASKHDRIAPGCPLCNMPVAVPVGEDPNIRMERHISEECSVMTGKSGRTSSLPLCTKDKCGKKLFAPIKCDKCNQQFCAQHRYPTTHACVSTARPNNPQAKSSSSKNFPAQTAVAGTTVMAAIRSLGSSTRPLASRTAGDSTAKPKSSAPAASSAPSNATTSSASSKLSNPFSKVDRRAEAERKSRRQAMLARAKKGLLSAEEQAKLEAELAESKGDSEDKGDCITM